MYSWLLQVACPGSWSSSTAVRFCICFSTLSAFFAVTVNFYVIFMHILIFFNSLHLLQSTGLRTPIEIRKDFRLPFFFIFICAFCHQYFFLLIFTPKPAIWTTENPEGPFASLYSELDKKVFASSFPENNFQVLTVFTDTCRCIQLKKANLWCFSLT